MADNVTDAINKAVAQVATNYGAVYVKNIKVALSAKDKLASGNLYNSVNYNVFIDAAGVHLEILALNYLKWVDLGRKPGTMPPVDAILKWIDERKLSTHPGATVRRNSIGKFSKGFKILQGRNKRGQFTSILQAKQKLAWAIAISIKKKGIKPANLSKSNDNVYSQMQIDATNAAVAVGTLYLGESFAQSLRESGLQVITTT